MTPDAIARAHRPDAPRGEAEREAEVRAVVVVGDGWRLALDRVPGVVRVRLLDHGGAAAMAAGTAIVEVWGGDVDDVLEAIRESTPAQVVVVAAVWPAGWRDRLGAWLRWQAWRIFRDPR